MNEQAIEALKQFDVSFSIIVSTLHARLQSCNALTDMRMYAEQLDRIVDCQQKTKAFVSFHKYLECQYEQFKSIHHKESDGNSSNINNNNNNNTKYLEVPTLQQLPPPPPPQLIASEGSRSIEVSIQSTTMAINNWNCDTNAYPSSSSIAPETRWRGITGYGTQPSSQANIYSDAVIGCAIDTDNDSDCIGNFIISLDVDAPSLPPSVGIIKEPSYGVNHNHNHNHTHAQHPGFDWNSGSDQADVDDDDDEYLAPATHTNSTKSSMRMDVPLELHDMKSWEPYDEDEDDDDNAITSVEEDDGEEYKGCEEYSNYDDDEDDSKNADISNNNINNKKNNANINITLNNTNNINSNNNNNNNNNNNINGVHGFEEEEEEDKPLRKTMAHFAGFFAATPTGQLEFKNDNVVKPSPSKWQQREKENQQIVAELSDEDDNDVIYDMKVTPNIADARIHIHIVDGAEKESESVEKAEEIACSEKNICNIGDDDESKKDEKDRDKSCADSESIHSSYDTDEPMLSKDIYFIKGKQRRIAFIDDKQKYGKELDKKAVDGCIHNHPHYHPLIYGNVEDREKAKAQLDAQDKLTAPQGEDIGEKHSVIDDDDAAARDYEDDEVGEATHCDIAEFSVHYSINALRDEIRQRFERQHEDFGRVIEVLRKSNHLKMKDRKDRKKKIKKIPQYAAMKRRQSHEVRYT